MQGKLVVTGMLTISVVGCWGEHRQSFSTTQEDMQLQTLSQVQVSPDPRLEAWGAAVEEALEAESDYQQVVSSLEAFGRISFSLPNRILRQEYTDLVADPVGEDRFVDLFFKDGALVSYDVGFKHASGQPAVNQFVMCDFRAGQTTLAELMAILGDTSPNLGPGRMLRFGGGEIVTWRVRVAELPVSFYAVVQPSDPGNLALSDMVTDLRAFDPSGRLLLSYCPDRFVIPR